MGFILTIPWLHIVYFEQVLPLYYILWNPPVFYNITPHFQKKSKFHFAIFIDVFYAHPFFLPHPPCYWFPLQILPFNSSYLIIIIISIVSPDSTSDHIRDWLVVITIMTPNSIYLSVYNITDSLISLEEYSTDVHIAHFLYPFTLGVHDCWSHSLAIVNSAVVNVGCSHCSCMLICNPLDPCQEQCSRDIM
jgi:hypothetical protein